MLQTVKSRKRVLFLCNHNSVRSQMAEGLLKSMYGEYYDVHSAGSSPSTLNPYAVKVMAEIGIDISKYRSKSIKEFQGTKFDYIVTVCNEGACPPFPGGKHYLHKSFKDPAAFEGSYEDEIIVFKEVRDEMKVWIEDTFKV